MLYPKNRSASPDAALFRNPTAEYRCTPFWAWNCDLDQETLDREIEYMKEMGMGGFHMHCRVGMSTRYLSDDFMKLVSGCVEKAKKENMLAWLYDEDKWPSGFAGGYVTDKVENRQKYLLLTPFSYEEKEGSSVDGSLALASRAGNGKLLARYDVVLDDNGCLSSYKRLADGEEAKGRVWYAYLETTSAGPWFHFKGYVDTMSPAAIKDFIDITHERYLEKIGNEFDRTVPAIFTDEPQMTRKKLLPYAKGTDDIILPFTTDFDDTYRASYGESILDTLPEVCWELPEGPSPVRYHYHDHATERFAEAYNDQIGKWCQKNGLLMTGHMMEEPTLRSQTNAVGECMRQYRNFGLPGVDMLCDQREFTTVKQAASAAHQNGNPGVLSELYGVTNWDFDFRGHKLQGDWQAALGVSVRVPHLYWVSMHGEAKRDYPASIGHQSAWYKEYPFIEDHFARVNMMMTRGKAHIRVGVVHPIESYWLHYGPTDQNGAELQDMDRRFQDMTNWLLDRTVDFDYICESTLPDMYRGSKDGFAVGEMKYDVVIVPACDTLRKTTIDRLDEFRKNGGRVVFMGDMPRYMDAVKSDEPRAFAEKCEKIDWSENALMRAVEAARDIEIRDVQGMPSHGLIYGMRDDGEGRDLFICHYEPAFRMRMDRPEKYTVTLRGEWTLTLYDTQTGDIIPFACRYDGGNTLFTWNCFQQSSILLRMEKGKGSLIEKDETAETRNVMLLNGPVSFTLDEPNACLIDTAQWRLDDGEWHDTEEMLRIGVQAKEALGLSTATAAGAQPWVFPAEEPTHTLHIRSTVYSDIEYKDITLAIEDIDDCEIRWNGELLKKDSLGHYVDDCLTKINAGTLKKGENILEVSKPFGVTTQTENMFLLGDFGVRVVGSRITVQEAPALLAFGDIVPQGLPFYGGKITYHFEVEGGQRTAVRLGLYAAPCVTVALDGKKMGNVSLAPYALDLGELEKGTHKLDITVALSRVNTFGAFHICDYAQGWYGPDMWRTKGDDWTYQYRLTRSGLLTEVSVIR